MLFIFIKSGQPIQAAEPSWAPPQKPPHQENLLALIQVYPEKNTNGNGQTFFSPKKQGNKAGMMKSKKYMHPLYQA